MFLFISKINSLPSRSVRIDKYILDSNGEWEQEIEPWAHEKIALIEDDVIDK